MGPSFAVHSTSDQNGPFATLLEAEITRLGLVKALPRTAADVSFISTASHSPALIDLVRTCHLSGRHLLVVAEQPISDRNLVWRLLRAGADDVLVFSDPAAFRQQASARIERWRQMQEVIASPIVRSNLIGSSPVWLQTLRQIIETTIYSDSSMLLIGESGTGKELLAQLSHAVDPRKTKKELMLLDCGTVVPELSGSEFFGHERGAFTGALNARDGAFALADGGTLFLDEVGELPLQLQAQLLRVIQERTYKRVGGNTWLKTNFRLIAATNRDLMSLVKDGRFRADLYYRLATTVVRVPPLRERREDICPLAQHFLAEGKSNDATALKLTPEIADYLVGRDFHGNVRELRQLIGRMRRRHTGTGPLTVGCIPEDDRPTPDDSAQGWPDADFQRDVRRALSSGRSLKEISKAAADSAVAAAIAEASGNLQAAARRLGVTDRALQLRKAGTEQPAARAK